MYEATMDNLVYSVSEYLKDQISSYPQIVADLMSEGYPVELMDGDAAHVPITWVLTVINKLKHQHSQNQKKSLFQS